MRGIAAILLIAFSAFTSEKMILPKHCIKPGKASECSVAKGKMGMMICAGNQKNKSDKTSSLPQCADCPLCMSMVHQAFTNIQYCIYFLQTEYIIVGVHKLAGYPSKQWKPPNRFSSTRLT